MTRTFTGLCVAAAFGMVASLGAQTTATSTPSQRSHSAMSNSSRGDEVTVTGCLEKGADGNYILTNARFDRGAAGAYQGATGATSGTSGTTTGTSTTAGTTTGSSSGSMSGTTSTSRSGEAGTGTTFRLEGGKNLDKHVGHRIQVTGREEHSSSSASNYGSSSGTTGSTAGTTGSTTGTTAGTTGSTAATGTTAQTGSMHHGEMGTSASAPRLDVKSVKMISTSCS